MKEYPFISRLSELVARCVPIVKPRLVKTARLAVIVPVLALMSNAAHPGEVFDAAKSGDLEGLQKLVVSGGDVNEKGVRGETPLIVASLEGHGEVVNYLLQRGADISDRNDDGMSPLHAAAYNGHDSVVSLLIAKGMNVNDTENRYVVSPLHVASEENRLSTVKLLVESGADVNATEANGYGSLARAGWRGHWDVVSYLLDHGAECQAVDVVGDWLHNECTNRKKS